MFISLIVLTGCLPPPLCEDGSEWHVGKECPAENVGHDTADTGDTNDSGSDETASVTIRHMPPFGELEYDVDSGLAHYLSFRVENTGTEDVDFGALTVHAHGDMDGGENGIGNTLDVGSRHQRCVLMEQANVLAEDIVGYNRGGEEVVSFEDYSFAIVAGHIVEFSVSCERDETLEVAETGEFYSLRISQYVAWDGVTVTTIDSDGNPSDVNGAPATWVAYYPE